MVKHSKVSRPLIHPGDASVQFVSRLWFYRHVAAPASKPRATYIWLLPRSLLLSIYSLPFFFQSGHWPQFVKIRRNNFPLLGTVMVMWGIGNVTVPSVVVKWWDLNLAELFLCARSGGRLKNPRCPHRFVYDRALRITDNNPGNHCGSGTWASRGGAD